MDQALGIIEVRGMVPATICIDAMVKSAFVEIDKIERVGSGLIAVMIKGDVASVQIALEIGADAAANYGEIVAINTIAKPDSKLKNLLLPEKGEQS